MNDRTQIDLTLNAYWKDYQNNVSIDMLYESQLRQCKLDESIDSLKELDGFLSNVRRDVQDKLTNAGRILSAEQRKNLLLKDERFCKLILFIGFYTGKVLSRVWKSQLICLDSSALQAMNPNYLDKDSFEHSLAIIFADIHKRQHLQSTKVHSLNEPWLFFVLEPIFMRLFGGFDYQVVSIQSKPTVADGLYKAVLERLPHSVVEKINQRQKLLQETPLITENPKLQQANSVQQSEPLNNLKKVQSESVNLPKSSVDLTQRSTAVSTATGITGLVSEKASESIMNSHPDVAQPIENNNYPNGQQNILTEEMSNDSISHLQRLENQNNNINQENNIQSTASKNVTGNSEKSPEKKVAMDILADIHSFQIPQNQGEEQYLQANQIMQKFDSYAKEQYDKFGKQIDELKFDPIQLKNRINALKVIKSVADSGNTTAMLHLSAYLMAGIWTQKNIEESVGLIQKAANMQDSRAMRALGRLYYQGLGVSQSSAVGKDWVEQAAALGHPEAKKIVSQIDIAQSMLAQRAKEQKSDKVYLIAIVTTAIICIIIMILF